MGYEFGELPYAALLGIAYLFILNIITLIVYIADKDYFDRQ